MLTRLTTLTRTQRTLAIVFACALPRLVFVWAMGVPETGVYYWDLATSLLDQHAMIYRGAVTAAFEPGYPAFLAAAHFVTGGSLFGVMLVQIVVACIGALLLDRLTSEMSGRSSAGLIAALLYATYPYLIRQSVAWMEITMLSTLLLAAWWMWARGKVIASMVMFGLAVLVRAMVLPIAVFAVLWLLWQRRLRSAALAAVTLLVMLAPWAIRGYQLEGAWMPTRSGENLYVGNNPYAAQMLPRYDLDLLPDLGEEAARRRLGVPSGAPVAPAALDRELTDEAVDYMKADPLRTALAKIWNVAYFFSPRLVPYEPNGPETTLTISPDARVHVNAPRQRPLPFELAHAAACALVLASGLAGFIWRRHFASNGAPQIDVLLLASVVVFALVAIVYFPTTRMRAPVEPIFMAYAGIVLSSLRREDDAEGAQDDVV